MEQRERLIQYVTKAQSGDKQALGMLFGECYDALYYFALKTVGGDSELAADMTQEACVEIQKTLGNLKEPAAFMSWAKKITYHQCTQHSRKKQDVLVTENEDGFTVFDTLEEDNADFIPDEALDKQDFRLTVMRIINGLPEVQRTAVMMYYYDEMKISEIAEIQGVSENTVKSRLRYAKDAIKAAVEDYEKKNNVKLHSFGFAPFLLWMFRGDKTASALSPAASSALAEGVSAATGTTVAASVSAGTAATGAAAGGVIGAKIAAGIAVVAGAAVAITGGIMAFTSSDKGKTDFDVSQTPTTAVVETVTNTVDLFENVTLTFEGMDGEGVAVVSGTCDEVDVIFEIDKEEGLTNGETVTVTATVSDGDLQALDLRGLTVAATEKTFTVTGLGVFMTDLSQFPQQEIDQITQTFLKKREEEFAGNADVTVTDVRCLGVQLCGPFHFVANNQENRVYVIFEVTAEIEGFGTVRYYSYATERDIISYGSNRTTMPTEEFGEPQHYGMVFGDVSGEGFAKGGVIFSGFERYDSLLEACWGDVIDSNVTGQGALMTGLDQLSAEEITVLTEMFETRCRARYRERGMTVSRVNYLGSYWIDATADDDYEPGDAIDATMQGWWFDFNSSNVLVNVYGVEVAAPDGSLVQTYQTSYKEDVIVYADGKTSMRQHDAVETFAEDTHSLYGISGTGFVRDDVLYDGYADLNGAVNALMTEVERYDMPYETTLS